MSEAAPAPSIRSATPRAEPALAGARIEGGSIRLFRVARIDVFLHWSWLLFALLRLQGGSGDDPSEFARYDAQAWYLVEYVGLFGMVLLHEFGHVLACRAVGGTANRIVLWPLGGFAAVAPPPRPAAWFWSIAAGPLVNVLLIGPTVAFWLACRAAGFEDAAPDVYRLAAGLAWINVYLLIFNLLPIFPLDGGWMLQSLLWAVLGRARSVLVTAVVGIVVVLTILVVAIVQGSLVWGVMACFGLVFSLLGVQGARALRRMAGAPRRAGVACPDCGAAPPIGNFWVCPRCYARFDAFASAGCCPNCSTPAATVLCPGCSGNRPYPAWLAAAGSDGAPVPVPAAPPPARPVTVAQRLVWGLVFAGIALLLCGLPVADTQPLGLVVWTAGGAILGAASAGTWTRAWRTNQARRQLRGTWQPVEAGDDELPRQLVLKPPFYQEYLGRKEEVRGGCWIDPLAEPPAISLTPKAGPDAGQPRPGIYRLDGTTLTLCLAGAGRPRPETFTTVPGVQQVQVYRRDGAGG